MRTPRAQCVATATAWPVGGAAEEAEKGGDRRRG